MTIDRAIEILDPNHRETYDSIEPINEACRMAVAALKAEKVRNVRGATLCTYCGRLVDWNWKWCPYCGRGVAKNA